MKRLFTAIAVIFVIFAAADVSAQSSLYKKKKYFGAIPMNSVTVYVGFLDGPDHGYLTEHLGDYAMLKGGSEVWENWSTSFYSRLGYRRQVAPRHFLVTNVNFAYLAAEGTGEFGLVADPPVWVTSERKLTTYLFSADLGFLYYMIKPTVRKIAPYIGGGFSAVLPVEKLESTFRSSSGEVINIDSENVSESSFEYGVYGQFGIDYFISNKWSAALDGRFQKTQSKFHMHGGNFDIDYSGLCLSLGLKYYF